MKSTLFMFLFCLVLHTKSFAQTTIEMESYGGVYRIPCIVNGAKMKFIFDTGASSVSISLAIAEYLFDNGYIQKGDILGVGTSAVADGGIVDHINIRLRDIEIAGLHLKNVDAVVIDGQNVPLLMGQSAIQKLGPIELDGNKLIIKNASSTSNYSNIIRKDNKGYKYIDTYLDTDRVLKSINYNMRGYVQYKGWDNSRSREFYNALAQFSTAIKEERISSGIDGTLCDSKGSLNNGTANWRDKYDRVITQEQYEALSPRQQKKCTKDFYPNMEVATYINSIVRLLYEKALKE